MADLQKTIEGLETQLDDLRNFADEDEPLTLTQEQAKEILELLKSQQAEISQPMNDLKKALIFQIENSTAKHPVDLIKEVLLILYSKGFADGEEYMENREGDGDE